MAAIAASNVTYVVEHENIVGQKRTRQNRVKVSFGNGALTYPSGGVPLTTTGMGLCEGVIESLKIIDDSDGSGIVWKYNYADNKLRGYQSAGFTPAGSNSSPGFTGTAAVWATATALLEEQHAVSSHTCTLKHLPAHIWMVEATAAGTAGPKSLVISTATPGAGEVAVNFSTGALTFAAAETVTEARVSYLPKAALNTASDLVVEETITMSSNLAALANNACLISCVYDTTNSKQYAVREKGISASSLSTKQCSVDFTPGAGNTNVTSNDTDDAAGTAGCKVTYIKAGAILVGGQVLTLVEEEGTTITSEEGVTAFPGIPSTGQWLNATAGTAGPHVLTTQLQALAAMSNGEAKWTYGPPLFATGTNISFQDASAVTACKITYCKLFPAEDSQAKITPAGSVAAPTFTGTAIAAGLLAELTTGAAPAAQVLYVEVTGY